MISTPPFSLCEGGRFHALLSKAGLTGGARGRLTGVALLLAIGWLPVILLTATAGTLASGVDHPLVADLGAWARALIVVPILVFALVAVSFPIIALLLAKIVRAGAADPVKAEPYECGVKAPTYALDTRFSIRYYLIAVLFVVFDVETIFLFPWAVMFEKLALFGFIEMVVFLAILLVGYVYAWRRGALEWA